MLEAHDVMFDSINEISVAQKLKELEARVAAMEKGAAKVREFTHEDATRDITNRK